MMLRLSTILALLAAPATAATLTFDGDICDGGTSCSSGEAIDQTTGDISGIDVIYDANVGTAASEDMLFWDDQYSDLTNVAYGFSGQSSAGISFVATGVDAVEVTGFDLGAWPNSDRDSEWTVIDLADDSVLASSGTITVDGASATSVSGTWTSAVGIQIVFGPDSFNVGIDNIEYGLAGIAAVPLPASGLMLLAGLGGLAARRRRRA